MRIIAGKAKGRTLVAPKVKVLRPTTDRVRESLFNILDVEGRSFLDLYAGAGTVGLEAASRGASRVVFVENNRACTEAIRANIERCGFLNMPMALPGDAAQNVEMIDCPAERALRLLGHRGERFDIIFADPPYEQDQAGAVLRLIRSLLLLAEGGIAVVQHGSREELPASREGFRIVDERRYGETQLSFLRPAESPEGTTERLAGR